MKVVSLNVSGISCSHCEHRICKNLLLSEGVKMASASFKDNKVIVKYDENITDENKIISNITESGYKIIK